MRNLSALFVLTLLISTTCRDDRPLIKLDPEFLSFIYFKEGTYWIYKDSASGELDSSYVSYFNPKINTTTDHTDREVLYEYIEFQWFFTNNIFNCRTYADSHGSCPDYGENSWSVMVISSPVSFAHVTLRKIYCNFITDDSLKLNNDVVYHNVVRFNVIENYNIHNSTKCYIYKLIWAQNIGIIKIYFGDGTVYEIERYKIIQ